MLRLPVHLMILGMVSLCLYTSPAQAADAYKQKMKDLVNSQSEEVQSFLARRAECRHWAGEDAYDAARGKQIAAAQERLHCDRLQDDEAKLSERYKNSPFTLDAIKRTRDY